MNRIIKVCVLQVILFEKGLLQGIKTENVCGI